MLLALSDHTNDASVRDEAAEVADAIERALPDEPTRAAFRTGVGGL